MVIDGKYFGNMNVSKVERVINKLRDKEVVADKKHNMVVKNFEKRRTTIVAAKDEEQPSIMVCGGTGCLALGSDEVVKALENSHKRTWSCGKSGIENDRLPGFL